VAGKPAEPAAPAAPPTAAPAAAWTGAAGLGFISLTGNSTNTVFSATAAAERKSADWIFGAKATAAYGRTRPAGDPPRPVEVTAWQGGAFLRADRRFTPSTSAYVLGGAETDHVKSVEVRYTGEAGASIIWVDWAEGDRKAILKTDLGFRVADERRFSFYPESSRGRVYPVEVLLEAPRLGVGLRYAMSKVVVFTDDAEVMPNVSGESRVLANNVAKLSARLSGAMQLGVSFTVAHDSKPAAGKKQTDTALAATVEYLF